MKIAIIGSGLASISAAKALIDRGMRPTIIDCGDVLDASRVKVVDKMSQLDAENWNAADLSIVTSNPTVKNKSTIPKKLEFGSDYFYGKADQYQRVQFDGTIPPFSYAKGGFSAGWGAAVLPPDENDLTAWPIGNKELEPYFQKILANNHYSAFDDDLSAVFPLYSKNANALQLTSGNKEVLKDLVNSIKINKQKDVIVGQSRLLVQVATNSLSGMQSDGCKYCGQCLSGCIYGYIYKSSRELDHLIALNKIDYISNSLVHSLSEKGGMVEILVENIETKSREMLLFNKTLLGAGAVNSTRIVLKSKKLYNKDVRLHSTVTFVAPAIRLKKMKIDWPNVNTQPGIFLEYKNNTQSNHWVHTQLSTPNELVLERLGIDMNKKGIMQWAKKKLIKHLIIAHGNIHSKDADGYILNLRKTDDSDTDILYSKREQKENTSRAIKQSVLKLSNILRRIGCIVILPAVQNSMESGGFHVGGTMPMRIKPVEEIDTNLLGVPKGWKNIHVIDSSVFPSLPSTTIGLLAMANATRIASEMEIN
jgi:hypothetical protein